MTHIWWNYPYTPRIASKNRIHFPYWFLAIGCWRFAGAAVSKHRYPTFVRVPTFGTRPNVPKASKRRQNDDGGKAEEIALGGGEAPLELGPPLMFTDTHYSRRHKNVYTHHIYTCENLCCWWLKIRGAPKSKAFVEDADRQCHASVPSWPV
jgi:hypothetical protein